MVPLYEKKYWLNWSSKSSSLPRSPFAVILIYCWLIRRTFSSWMKPDFSIGQNMSLIFFNWLFVTLEPSTWGIFIWSHNQKIQTQVRRLQRIQLWHLINNDLCCFISLVLSSKGWTWTDFIFRHNQGKQVNWEDRRW